MLDLYTFTFHYVYIYMPEDRGTVILAMRFTFHYVYIYITLFP